MSEILRLYTANFKQCEKAFGIYLPSASLIPVKYQELPKSLKQQIEKENNCGLSIKVNHQDLGTTYIAEFTGLDLFYLEDRNTENKYAGEGRVYVESSDESEIPVVGYTYTSEKSRRLGFGTRRLFVMNALSRVKFKTPISSSGSPKPTQRSIWEKLVDEEIAEIHYWNGTQRYKFS